MNTRLPSTISRRDFLRLTAVTSGGLLLAGCAPSIPSSEIPTTGVTPKPIPPLKISVMWREGTNPLNKDSDFYRAVVERTGIAFDGFGLPPGPDYTQKVNAVMASGQPPDLMWVNDSIAYSQYATQGAFWDLDEFLVDKAVLPQLTSYPSYAYDALRVDGKVFAIPSYRIYRGFPVHIRKDWLDKLGLNMPTTIDELWRVAETFATKDPDGNGKKDTYGLMWWQNLQGLDQILYGFGIVTSWEEDKPGHIIPAFITEKYKRMLTWLRAGIEAGIFDPDSVIMKRDEVETVKGNAGKTGVFYTGSGGRTLNAIQKNIPSAMLLPLPPLLTPEGKYAYSIPFLYIGMWVVTKSVKSKEDVERILKFVDYGSSPEGGDLLQYGIPGDYDVNPDGTKTLTDKGNKDGVDSIWFIPPPDKYLYAELEKSLGQPLLAEAERKLVDSVEPILIPDPILFTLPGPVELQKGSDLGFKRDEVFSKILAGQLPISVFDDWVNEWRKNGGDQIIDERSNSYAERKK